jgi:hypothetical protein
MIARKIDNKRGNEIATGPITTKSFHDAFASCRITKEMISSKMAVKVSIMVHSFLEPNKTVRGEI